ncbi:cadmium-translocating P-type ATPase [bacterium]|nr:cadmium-translocating P-type ATPase [bacterium]
MFVKSSVPNISTEKQKKQMAFRLLGTFLGGSLVLNAYFGKLFLGFSNDVNSLSAFLGALVLSIPIFYSASKSLFQKKIHMEALVAIALFGCFALEDYLTAGIVAFIMLGAELIQSRTALGARAAIEGLIKLTPTKARKIISDNQQQEIPAHELTRGDKILILPGDNIAADALITKGAATINEASITGESIPAEKQTGDKIFAGTINLTGKLEAEVIRAGEDTTLGKVKKLILEAETSKIPIMRIIDQYASWYAPLILMISCIILYFTKDLNRAITALVVTCPCALVLATPTAVVAALSCAARLGILVKNVKHLEIASKLNALVFDKTGTLTTGELTVTKLSPIDSSETAGEKLLLIAGSLARYSSHPASKAVVNTANQANLSFNDVHDVQEKAGLGISGIVDNKKVLIGKRQWLKENKITIAKNTSNMDGLSIIYVAFGNEYIGWIGLEDKTREEAKSATEQLHQIGIRKIIMLTGDRESVAKKVAAELGCQDYKAQCLPEEKLEAVHKLQKEGYCVGVIGDGINDAPALAAGDIGIAMGAAGSDIAIHSASISLMNNDLTRLPFIITISKKTKLIMYENLLFGIIFIVVGLVSSSLGYLNPIIAAIMHNVGSFIVIFNSARLIRFGEELTIHSDIQREEN